MEMNGERDSSVKLARIAENTDADGTEWEVG